MRKFILSLAVILICISGRTQEKRYKSVSAIKTVTIFESTFIERDVTINDKQIIITNVLNGGKENLVLNIEKIQEKEFEYNENMLWYYCTPVQKGYPKYIVIIDKYSTDLKVFGFADEVTVFRADYRIKKIN